MKRGKLQFGSARERGKNLEVYERKKEKKKKRKKKKLSRYP
jgi:hypothetical protein